MEIRRIAGLAWNWLLMRVDNSTGKGTFGMDKFSSKVHRVHMELRGKLLNSWESRPSQILERLQSVSVVDGAVLTQKDDVESNGGSLEIVAEIFVLSFCGVQLVLRSGVLTILDLDEVDVTPRFAEVFRSVLSEVGGSTGGWRCCWGAPSHPQMPPATPKTHPPTFVVFVFLQRKENCLPYYLSSRMCVNLHQVWCSVYVCVSFAFVRRICLLSACQVSKPETS